MPAPFLAALLAAAAHAAPGVTWNGGVDLPLTLGTGAIWAGLYLGGGRQPVTADASVGEPGGIDALGRTRVDAGAARASDALLYGTLALGLGGTPILAGPGAAGPALGNVVEAFAINGAITELTKQAVDRPRPYTLGDGRTGSPDDDKSFFSGHSSTTAAVAFAAARTVDLSADLAPAARVGLYGGATALSATTAALRVAAGKHWPSDVIVGLLVGGSVGWLVPELHRADRAGVALSAGPASLRVAGRF